MLMRKTALLILYHIDPDFICKKRYAFAIRGFALTAVDCVTEVGIEHVNVAADEFIGLFIALIFSCLLD